MEHLLVLLYCVCVGVSSDPVVTGSLGRVTGKAERVLGVDLDSFLGIPYAKPPLGDLRFAPPEAFGELADYLATEYALACPQLHFGFAEVGGTHSEDCLYLNVYRKTGTSGADKKAVSITSIY